MGTRNLSCAYMDGEFKVAQYGQWDGYPEGQGLTILEFLRSTDLNEFKNVLNEVKFVNDDQNKVISEDKNWEQNWPQMNRDVGGQIFDLIMNNNVRLVHNSVDFAGDSLFCEWAYVIDLDANTFEVYEGFVKDKECVGRFKDFIAEDRHIEYQPVTLIKSFALDNLPTSDEFVKACYEHYQKDEEDE